jgi:hypothetical protein
VTHINKSLVRGDSPDNNSVSFFSCKFLMTKSSWDKHALKKKASTAPSRLHGQDAWTEGKLIFHSEN